MATYTKSTGATGTMYIHDNGTTIEFLINAGQTSTWVARMPWRYTINNKTSAWQYYNHTSGGGTRSLGVFTPGRYDQTVKFELGDTGSYGLGGPTTLTANIKRVSEPPKPPPWKITSVRDQSVSGTYPDVIDNGGSPLTKVELRYGKSSDMTSSSNTTIVIPNNVSYTVQNLSRDTVYYFWIRYTNAIGTGLWSDYAAVRTYDVAAGGSTPIISNVTQSSVNVSYTVTVYTGGKPIMSARVGYGTDPNAPQKYVTGTKMTISGLTPGLTYYFWGQAYTEFGWGDLSGRASAKLPAGMWYFYQGQWRRAVPYVRVNGVWKPAAPLINIAGLWRPGG